MEELLKNALKEDPANPFLQGHFEALDGANEKQNAREAVADCSESFDTEHRDHITCPKCGDHDPESEKFTKLAETKETGKCSTCGQVFHVIRHVTITYSTICIPNASAMAPPPQRLPSTNDVPGG